jgi:hypothetical protein
MVHIREFGSTDQTVSSLYLPVFEETILGSVESYVQFRHIFIKYLIYRDGILVVLC